ncbi:MAG: c-type cytochrome [Erythrobacter sp.]
MALRKFLAGSSLALSLAACSGGGDEPVAADAPDTVAMETPVDTTAEAADGDVAVDASSEEAEDAISKEEEPKAVEAKKPEPEPELTKAATATPEVEVASAAPPASFNRCAVCHTANKGGEDKLGPNLWGSYGAKAGQGSFAYSDALKNSALTFDEATLHSWLENPRALVPGNRMSFPGLKDAAKRQEIIDYLKKQR